jgi:hypothetical protein
VPPDAHAGKNTGKFQQSLEAKQKVALCSDLLAIFSQSVKDAAAKTPPGTNPASIACPDCTSAYSDAERSGCGWAA